MSRVLLIYKKETFHGSISHETFACRHYCKYVKGKHFIFQYYNDTFACQHYCKYVKRKRFVVQCHNDKVACQHYYKYVKRKHFNHETP